MSAFVGPPRSRNTSAQRVQGIMQPLTLIHTDAGNRFSHDVDGDGDHPKDAKSDDAHTHGEFLWHGKRPIGLEFVFEDGELLRHVAHRLLGLQLESLRSGTNHTHTHNTQTHSAQTHITGSTVCALHTGIIAKRRVRANHRMPRRGGDLLLSVLLRRVVIGLKSFVLCHDGLELVPDFLLGAVLLCEDGF